MNVLPDDILRAIRQIVKGVDERSRLLFAQTGLTMPQILCLRAVASMPEGEATAALVSREVELSPATVTGIIDRLERVGMLFRDRRSRDRRKIALVLTEKGQEYVNTLPDTLHDRFKERLEELAPAERQEMLEILNKVVSLMEASELRVSPVLASGDLREDYLREE